MLFFLLFICHCASTITNEEQENYTTQQQQQHTDTSTEIVSYFLDNSSFYDDYSYVRSVVVVEIHV